MTNLLQYYFTKVRQASQKRFQAGRNFKQCAKTMLEGELRLVKGCNRILVRPFLPDLETPGGLQGGIARSSRHLVATRDYTQIYGHGDSDGLS